MRPAWRPQQEAEGRSAEAPLGNKVAFFHVPPLTCKTVSGWKPVGGEQTGGKACRLCVCAPRVGGDVVEIIGVGG